MNRSTRHRPPPRRTATTPRLGRRIRSGGTAILSEHALSDEVVETIAETGSGEHVRAEVVLTVLGPAGEAVRARLTRPAGRLVLEVGEMTLDPGSDHIWAWHEALVEREMTVDLAQDGQVVVTIGDWDQRTSA